MRSRCRCERVPSTDRHYYDLGQGISYIAQVNGEVLPDAWSAAVDGPDWRVLGHAGAESLGSTLKHKHHQRHGCVHMAKCSAAVCNWMIYNNSTRRHRRPVSAFRTTGRLNSVHHGTVDCVTLLSGPGLNEEVLPSGNERI